MIWLLVAMAAASDPELAREEGLVAEAAAAVAQARHDGLRASRIAELMASYRQEAERLAGMQTPPAVAQDQRGRDLAVRALTDATARGAADATSRSTIDAWLGPLVGRLDLLDSALAAATSSPVDLGRQIAVDVESQALAVMITATYDASRADEDARRARTGAAALRAESNPLEHTGLAVEVDLRALEQAADAATARAATLRSLALRASALRDAAHLTSEE